MLKLVFAGFVQAGMMNGADVYTSEVSAQNVFDQAMPGRIHEEKVAPQAAGTQAGIGH